MHLASASEENFELKPNLPSFTLLQVSIPLNVPFILKNENWWNILMLGKASK